MEAPNGVLPSLWNFIRNLIVFILLFLLAIAKGELQLLLSFGGIFVLFLVIVLLPMANDPDGGIKYLNFIFEVSKVTC